MSDFHGHGTDSTFDGYGTADERATVAKEKGHKSLGLTDHGTTSGLVKHYRACKENDLIPVLGVEAYFIPELASDFEKVLAAAKEEKKRLPNYHLCLFAKNIIGYQNMNKIMSEAQKTFYFRAHVTMDTLKNYSKGVVCSSACISSYFSVMILKGYDTLAIKMLEWFKKVFGDDFYIEIQPYEVEELAHDSDLYVEVVSKYNPNITGKQLYVNTRLIEFAKQLDIKCILTSDSHRPLKEDLPTYIKMHEVAGSHLYDIEKTYGDRYIPDAGEMEQRFIMMHPGEGRNGEELYDPVSFAAEMERNAEELEQKFDVDILEWVSPSIPTLYDDSKKKILELVKQGLERRGKYLPEYIERAKEELKIIFMHKDFPEYFLIDEDFINELKRRNIWVGPARGSSANSLVAYALGITEVDSLLHGLEFRRFLREDKVKLPDIDTDIETERRQEAIDYLIEKYGNACQVSTYGLYKVDNLLNDLAKHCGLPTDKGTPDGQREENKEILDNIKKYVSSFTDESGAVDLEALKKDPKSDMYDDFYDGIITHFCGLYKQTRNKGVHAAGVIITNDDITKYVALKRTKGRIVAEHDLADCEALGLVKFDLLGLGTGSEIMAMRDRVGKPDLDKIIDDELIIKAFRDGDTGLIFQYEKATPRKMLKLIECDSFKDVVAVNAMNRPGPLGLKLQDKYVEGKKAYKEGRAQDETVYSKYLRKTYGTILYQEQVQQICAELAGMEWTEADKIIKLSSSRFGSEEKQQEFNRVYSEYLERFQDGMRMHRVSDKESEELFKQFWNYSFNEGHAVAYTLIAFEEMHYKVYHPAEFWAVKAYYKEQEIAERVKIIKEAVRKGIMTLLPQINNSGVHAELIEEDGEKAIQFGLMAVKGLGENACNVIVNERDNNGPYKNEVDMFERCKPYGITMSHIKALQDSPAFIFDETEHAMESMRLMAHYRAQVLREK